MQKSTKPKEDKKMYISNEQTHSQKISNIQCLPISYPNYATIRGTLVFLNFSLEMRIKLTKGNTPSTQLMRIGKQPNEKDQKIPNKRSQKETKSQLPKQDKKFNNTKRKRFQANKKV